MLKLIDVYIKNNNNFYIFKGNYLGCECLTLFKLPINITNHSNLVINELYSIDYLLLNLFFMCRIYISELNSEDFIIKNFYKYHSYG